jgi:hypothetical protein
LRRNRNRQYQWDLLCRVKFRLHGKRPDQRQDGDMPHPQPVYHRPDRCGFMHTDNSWIGQWLSANNLFRTNHVFCDSRGRFL